MRKRSIPCIVYFDIDGTLNKWRPNATIEETHRKGFFEEAEPQHGIIALANALINMGICVMVASSTYEDDHSEGEKRRWLKRFLPALASNRQIYVPYGVGKEQYLIHTTKDLLISDRTENELESWTGRGIKVMNGHNGKQGRWKGTKISASDNLQSMIDAVMKVLAA